MEGGGYSVTSTLYFPEYQAGDGIYLADVSLLQLEDKLPSLEDQGIERLVPQTLDRDDTDKDGKHIDRALELKRLAKSLLLNYLELVGTLSINPTQGRVKTADLSTLLINFHHILNEYRPHQARESAIALMQEHLDQTRAETAAIKAQIDNAKRVLVGLASIEAPPMPAPPASSSPDEEFAAERMQEARDARRQEAWRSINEFLA
jgi:mediator of RNA polymerase II transcription subunit 7